MSHKSPEIFRQTSSLGDESSCQDSMIGRKFTLQSAKDKMSILGEDTKSQESPCFPLEKILKPELIMK